jgi:hypothetical protein
MHNQPLHVFKSSYLRIVVAAALILIALPGRVTAQQNNAAASSTVPQIIQFSGQLNETSGGGAAPVPSGTVSVTFTLYENEQGGTALWSETDNVQVDAQGHYTALLGSASPAGLPLNLFTTGQAHWLAVQPLFEGFGEQPRVLLVSAPYALKAGDAETIGGLPPSAFLLANPTGGAANGAPAGSSGNTSAGSSGSTSGGTAGGASNNPPPANVTGSGTTNYLPLWTSTSSIGNSALFQSGSGNNVKVGIGTTTPKANLDVKGSADIRGALTMESLGKATSSAGFNSHPFVLRGSSYDSSNSTAVSQHFRWQVEPLGNNTANPSGSLNLLYASGPGNPVETGLSIGSNGLFTFATGQTFPGTGNGTITGVVAGTDLTGGGTSGAVTLNLDTTQVPTLGAASNVFTGSITASSFTGNGAAVTNVNAALLDGLASSAFQPAGSYATLGANTFGDTQTISSGNLALPTTTASNSGVLTFGGQPFVHDFGGASNAFLGASAGNFSNTGTNNTATGNQALSGITSGSNNTALGYQAGVTGTVGDANTAGSNNTFIGYNSGPGTATQLTNATAIGANALVSASNALALGGTGANAVSVGIGTATPVATLEVNGTAQFDNNITFAPGQAFPGTGTITGVTAGADLTGGGTSGSVTLNVDTTKVPTLGAATNVFTGSITASSFTGNGAAVTNVNAALLDGLASSAFQPAGSYATLGANTFSGDQNITGNLTASGTVTGAAVNATARFNLGGNAFAFGSFSNGNAFLGFAGNFGTTGAYNTASGYQALGSNTTGQENTASGYQALQNNTTGQGNTASGYRALTNNTTGDSNTASGHSALLNNTTGEANTASGVSALANNTTGTENTASGKQALYYNTTGTENTASGVLALGGNTTGSDNTASGWKALLNNTTGGGNTASGLQALTNNTTGNSNTASGAQALYYNTTGTYNTASGVSALQDNTTGNNNIAIGLNAAENVSGGNSNNIHIGSLGSSGDSGAIRIGTSGTQISADIAGIYGTGVGGTNSSVCIDNTGLLGTVNCPAAGTGTITGVTAGTGLAGGGTSGNVTLSIASNACGAGNALIALPFTCSPFATLGANTFSGDQNITGNLTASLTVTGGVVNASSSFNLGGTPFAFGSTSTDNVFLGFAGNTTTTGSFNTASGYQALLNNTTGGFSDGFGVEGNTASGYQALYSNTTGGANTAIGSQALYTYNDINGNASGNTAVGAQALFYTTNGAFNTASGTYALTNNTTGDGNTAVGYGALEFNQTGTNVTCIGYECSATADGLKNATAIGAHAAVGESNALVLGGTGPYAVKVGIGTATPSSVLTIAQGAGHPVSDGWETFSSRRWKTNIQTLQGALGKVEQLRGVSYDLKATGKHEVGVIAEEVGAVVPELVTWEKNGKDAQSVDYSRLTALLIEATKEQQTLIHQQQDQLKAQQAHEQEQQTELKAQQTLAGKQQEQIKAQQVLLKTQQAQIGQLASQMKTIQASLRTRRGSGHARLASAKGTPAPGKADPNQAETNRVIASPERGGN